jgi:hypothetical protein
MLRRKERKAFADRSSVAKEKRSHFVQKTLSVRSVVY